MKIRIGCDIVEIKRLKKLNKRVLGKIFHKSEMSTKIETLAGIFAAKEACKKVFNELNWMDIEIKKKKNGKPELILVNKQIEDYDLSISHDGGYAMANVVFMIKN